MKTVLVLAFAVTLSLKVTALPVNNTQESSTISTLVGDTTEDLDGLSTGAILGIVIGILGFLVALIVLCVCCIGCEVVMEIICCCCAAEQLCCSL